MGLRIRTISKLTGIREATLRAWERRYGFPQPVRSQNNYRAYSREDAEAIRRVVRLLERGYMASEAIAEVRATPIDSLPARQRLEEQFWSAVMVLDGDAVTSVLDEAQATMEPLALADEFLLPLLRKMSARLDVGREHLASAAIRQRLRSLLSRVDGEPTGPGVLLACPPGDHHEGGILGIALHLRTRGWRVMVLGGDTPAEALRTACVAGKAELVALSFVREYAPAEFEATLRELRQVIPVPLVVGGPAARENLKVVFDHGAFFADSAGDLIALHARLTQKNGAQPPPAQGNGHGGTAQGNGQPNGHGNGQRGGGWIGLLNAQADRRSGPPSAPSADWSGAGGWAAASGSR